MDDAYGDSRNYREAAAPWSRNNQHSASVDNISRVRESEAGGVTLPQMIEKLRMSRQNLRY